MIKRISCVSAAVVLCIGSVTHAELIYGHSEGRLTSWDSSAPSDLLSVASGPGGSVVAIDFRPANNQLYGIRGGSILTISPGNGTVASDSAGRLPLNGFGFGVDFSPVTDRMHAVSDLDESQSALVIGRDSNLVLPTLVYASGDVNAGRSPGIVDIAFSNNVAGALTTQLYGIDAVLDALVAIDPATGLMNTVGPLGVDVAVAGGFDISGRTGAAYAALLPGGNSQSELYAIDLSTGGVTSLGVIGGGSVFTTMAIYPLPEPTSLWLLALGLCCSLAKRNWIWQSAIRSSD